MKFRFFGEDNPEINKSLILYVLSFLEPSDHLNAALVSKRWRELVGLTRGYLALLPTIHEVPLFSNLGLDVLRLKLMAGGMTNSTYRVRVKSDPEKWVMRVPGKGSSAFITRSDEAHNASQAHDLKLNVPIAYFNPESGLQVTRFIDGVKPLDKEALARKEILQKIALMMRNLHSSTPFKNETRFFERNEDLLEQLKQKKFIFPGDISFIEEQMKRLKELFSTYQIRMYPCHNDTTPLNFILSTAGAASISDARIYEIDWEYSSNNDFLWDLVYFAVEAKLSKEQLELLLSTYFGSEQVSKSVMAWVEVYKPIIEWWITIWSWTQLANKADAVELEAYERLGSERYESTLNCLKSQEFESAMEVIEADKTDMSFSGKRPF